MVTVASAGLGPGASTTVRTPLPVDLADTLWPLRRGTGDPAVRADRDGSWWRATRTPIGPATARYAPAPEGVAVCAWGPGAAWLVEHAPELLGATDHLEGFAPVGIIRELHRRHPGLRITRSRCVFEALVPTVFEQKVTGLEARRAYRALLRSFGEPAPGPAGLRTPPSAERLAALPYYAFHRLGIERRRAEVIRWAAARAPLLDGLVDVGAEVAGRRLRSLPGIGGWSAAEVAIVALGDADAVSLGDYHLPHVVSWALTGERRGSDERMLELLAPYAGHRGRVLRLLSTAGVGPPRRGPRMPVRSIRSL